MKEKILDLIPVLILVFALSMVSCAIFYMGRTLHKANQEDEKVKRLIIPGNYFPVEGDIKYIQIIPKERTEDSATYEFHLSDIHFVKVDTKTNKIISVIYR